MNFINNNFTSITSKGLDKAKDKNLQIEVSEKLGSKITCQFIQTITYHHR